MAQRRQTRTIKRQKPKAEFPEDLPEGPQDDQGDSTISEEEWDRIQARSAAAVHDDAPDVPPGPTTPPDPQPQRPRRIDQAEETEDGEETRVVQPHVKPQPQRPRRIERGAPPETPDQADRKTKRELFKSSIKERLGRTRKSIEVLGNCGNRTSYEYTIREAEQVIEIVEKALDGLRIAFAEKQREVDVDFDFDEE